MTTETNPVCAFCRIRLGVERGHVVPKGFFCPQPTSGNFPRVPSCAECERGRGDGGPYAITMDEEYLRDCLTLNDKSYQNSAQAKRLFDKKVYPNMARGRGHPLAGKMKYYATVNEFGIIDPQGRIGYPFEMKRVARVVSKITLGMFAALNGFPLPLGYVVMPKAQPTPKQLRSWLDKFIAGKTTFGPATIGDNVFWYAGIQSTTDVNEQAFLMRFFGHHYSFGLTKRRTDG